MLKLPQESWGIIVIFIANNKRINFVRGRGENLSTSEIKGECFPPIFIGSQMKAFSFPSLSK